MNNHQKLKPTAAAYTLAAMAGISFVCGLVLLASETSL
jgi:hypothetical protein